MRKGGEARKRRKRRTSARRRQEKAALNLLLEDLRQTQGEEWVFLKGPDELLREEKTYDFEIAESESGGMAAVEVTSFDWPMDVQTVLSSMRSVCAEVSMQLNGSVSGTFMLGVDLLAVREAGIFSRRMRSRTCSQLATLVKTAGFSMGVGETRHFTDPFQLSLTRGTDSGDGRLVWGGSSHSVLLDKETEELQAVIKDNARKFEGFRDIRRWLLVVYLGGESGLHLVQPNLRLPTEIDALFFIVYEHSQPRIADLRLSQSYES